MRKRERFKMLNMLYMALWYMPESSGTEKMIQNDHEAMVNLDDIKKLS